MNSIPRSPALGVLAAVTLSFGVGLGACSSSSGNAAGSSASSASTCAQICTPIAAAHCPNDGTDCTGSCAQEQASVPASCQSQNQALIACAGHATYACDSDGQASPVGCDAQISAYATCFNANPPATTGGADGGTSSNPGTTPIGCQTTGASCGDCVATSCCTETTACNASSDCSLLSTCLTRCISTDQACTSACENLYPDATSLYENVTSCVSQSCTYACTEPPAGCTYVTDPSADGCGSTGFPVPWSCTAGAPQEPVPCNAAPDGTPNVYCCLE